MINLNCALNIKSLYGRGAYKVNGRTNCYVERQSSLAPLKADTVSFSGLIKNCNKNDYREIEEKILKINDIAQTKNKATHGDIENCLNEKNLKVRPIEEMTDIGADPDSCFGYTTEDITADIELGENGEKFLTKLENNGNNMFVSEVKGKDKNVTLSTIAHEYTHVKQIQKNPSLIAEITIKHLQEKKLNTKEIVLTCLSELQSACAEISGEMGNNILSHLLNSRCEEVRRDPTPLKYNMEGALLKGLGGENMKELNECVKLYINDVAKIISNEIKNKHKEEFSKKFSTDAEIEKYLENLVRKTISIIFEKEFEAYTNQGKIIKKLHGIPENSVIGTDVLAQTHKLLLDNCD